MEETGNDCFFICDDGICGCQKTDYEKQEEENKKEELVIWSYYETQAQRDGLNKLTGISISPRINIMYRGNMCL